MLVIYTKTHVSYLHPNRLCEIYPNETTLSRWEVIIRQYKLFITICVLWRKNRIIDTYSMYLHVFSDMNSNIILLNTLDGKVLFFSFLKYSFCWDNINSSILPLLSFFPIQTDKFSNWKIKDRQCLHFEAANHMFFK